MRVPSVNFFNVENIQDWGMDGEVKMQGRLEDVVKISRDKHRKNECR